MSDHLQAMLDQISTPEDLRRLLDIPGMDDTVINQFIAGVGAETMLDKTFALMASRFIPRGRLRRGVVQWNIQTTTGRHGYQTVLTPAGATVRTKDLPRPSVVLAMSAPTLLRLCTGRLNSIAAFRKGDVKIRGNLLTGARLSHWFDYGLS